MISKQEHDAVHEQVAKQHAVIEPILASRGGTVLARYHDALNGIKVEIPRSEVAGLATLPGVVQVVPVPKYNINNVVSVPFIGAPQVWQGTPAFRGEHVKIAIIDTGIDYTHANFGGPGTVAAFAAAAATSTAPADPTMFGPAAPKVKGGIDLVGDAYNADVPGSMPVPDPNPLDCNGHGSHVSGTAAGFGVANDGTTYHGPYDQAAYAAGFGIGPGVAPLADLYMVRVFGCTGSSNVITEAIDWAVHNDMDVISMSLGGTFGTATSSDSIASDNAAKAGIVVVAAAGVAARAVDNAAALFNPAIPGVTIPFIELEKSDSVKFLSATAPVSASITPAHLPNAGFKLAANFSSGGPRTGDGALEPDVTAPGVNVFSTNIGTGNGGTYDSGTSMATPHVAGVAALAIQAHHNWKESGVRAAVVETASPTALGDYAPRIEGAGLAEAVRATTTDVTVAGCEDRELGLLSFGVAELTRDFHEDRELIVRNHGRIPATFTATATQVGGVPHTVTLSSSTVSVEGHDDASLRVSLTVPAATAGSTHDAAGQGLLPHVRG